MADTNIFNTQLIDINSLEAFWRRIKGDINILENDIINRVNNIKREVDNKFQNITINYNGQINDLYDQVDGINNIIGSININDYYTKTEVDNKYVSKAEFDIASAEKIYSSIFSDMVIYFHDYDGTVLYTYLIPELISMPKLPTRDGLICQGWTYDIDYIDACAGVYDKLDVGATYITDDGKTRLYISITTSGINIPICFTQTVSGGVIIDWGDGSAQQRIASTGNIYIPHTYNEIGDYIITLNPDSGCILGIGTPEGGIGSTSIRPNSTSTTRRGLKKVEIGNNVSISDNVFYDCTSLSSIVIPNSVTSIGTHAFDGCTSLSSIFIPNSVTSIGAYAFQYCASLSSIVIPNSVTSIGPYAFKGCTSLSSIVIPNSVTSIETYEAFYNCSSLSSIVIPNGVTIIDSSAFRNCSSLSSIVIPNGVTSFSSYAFSGCTSLSSIVIPNSVTSIGAYAFQNCTKMKYYDFSQHTTIPTLSTISFPDVFTNIPSDCKIIVPDSLYDSWIVASNWKTYASYIIKKSDWDAQQS